jgi:predicted transcriptional regulator
MAHTISLSSDVYTLLQERARQAQTSPDALADEALRQYLNEAEQDWRKAFEVLIARVQARTVDFAADEIEADITTAADEVKESRRGRPRAG